MELVLVTNNALLVLNVAEFGCRHQNCSETNGGIKGDYVSVRINSSEMVRLCEDRERCGGRISFAQRPLNTRKSKNIFRRFHRIAKSNY